MSYKLGVDARGFSAEHKPVVRDLGNGLGAVVSRILGTSDVAAYVEGVDVSGWQGIIDWDVMYSKAAFVIIRAGYGNSSLDARVEYNVTNAAALGIPYGIYWYVKPAHDAKKHAAAFANAYKEFGGSIEPTFDLEETGGLDKNALYNWYAKLYNEFGNLTGLNFPQMMTYTSPGFLDRAIPLTNFIKWTKLWVAHWTTAAQPIIPQEWAKGGFSWAYWQYSAKGDGIAYGAQSKSIDLVRKNEQASQPPAPPLPEFPKHVRVTAGDGLNYRDADGNDIGTFVYNSDFYVDRQDGDYYWLTPGKVHKDYVRDA